MRLVRVALEYFHPWPNSAGFYYARQAGFFAERGMRVEFVLTDPSIGDALHYLQQQWVDFAIFPSNRLFVRRTQQQGVLGIAAINHTGLECIQSLRRFAIFRPRDLQDKRLALNPTPRGMAMVKHLVEADGGDFKRVQLIDAACREYTPSELSAGLADASFGGYWAWEALMDSPVAKEERVVLPVSEFGAPNYHSYLLGVHEQQQQCSDAQIYSFVAALAKGYQALRHQPELAQACYEAVIPYFPQQLIQLSLQKIAPTWFADQHWGMQNLAFHQEYAAWLHHYRVLSDPDIWKVAVSNRYVEECAHA